MGPPPPTAHDSSITHWLGSQVWLALAAGGAGLVLVGALLLFRADGSSDAGRKDRSRLDRSSGTEAVDADKSAEVFRPAVRPQDTDIASPSTVLAPGDPEPRVEAAKRDQTIRVPREAGSSLSLESWSLRDFGIEIPAGANLLEIDGVAIPVQDPVGLAGRGGVPLVLPMGKHIVRFARSGAARVVEPRRWFLDGYREAAALVHENGRWSFDRLLELSRSSLDRFTEPLIPHFWGNFYWQEGERDAAARHFSWALEIAPTFAPSYLNLARLAHEQGDDEKARRYLRLADLWNAQNAYGISLASTLLWVSIGQGEAPAADEDPDWLVPRHGELAGRDRDMAAILRSAAEFAPRSNQRAKILNNLGAYFEHEGRPELAMEHYRLAAAAIGSGQLSAEERPVIQAILDNLARVCRNADMPEYRRYERMRAMVQP